MKLKYYLRGLGIGIIVTTIILMIAFSRQKNNISDEEVIRRAEALGMVMQEIEPEDLMENSEEHLTEDSEEMQGMSEEQKEPETSENPESVSDTQMTESGVEDGIRTQADYMLVVKKGMVCRDICEELQANGVIEDAEAFRKYLGEVGYAKNISTGTYQLPYGLTYEELYHVLLSGPVFED